MIQLFAGNREITGLTTELILEKHVRMPAAQLRVKVVFESFTGFLPFPDIVCGSTLTLTDGQRQIFKGSVVEKRMHDNLMELLAYDPARLLAVNEVQGVFTGTCAAIGQKLCGMVGLNPGKMPAIDGGTIISRGGMTPLLILQQICGNDYYISYPDSLNIHRVGSVHVELPPNSLLALESCQSLLSMVNHAVVTNTRGLKIGSAQLPEESKAYGCAKRYYHSSGSIADGNALAQSKLQGLVSQGTLLLGGDFRLTCGQCLTAAYPQFGFVGNYILWNVRHEIRAGIHTTSLDLRKEALK